MRCTVCFDGYHYACLDFDKKKVKKIKEVGFAKWTCPDCKTCDVCAQRGFTLAVNLMFADDENALVVCSLCDRGYHPLCLQFPPKITSKLFTFSN